MEELTSEAQKKCAFHIFASLAGGTGSGGIIDVVTTIRNHYKSGGMEDGFPIFVHVYATSDDAQGADVGFFYQNQYAALRDLNALMCGRFKPNLLGSDSRGAKFEGSDPIAQLVVSTNLNSNQYSLPLKTQIRIVAEASFERLCAWTAGQMSADSQRALTGQDILGNFQGEPSIRPERSYRFGSLGMRRWEVPDARINELLALDVLTASLSQMLYNNWHTEEGFILTRTSLDQASIDVHLSTLEKRIEPFLLTSTRLPELVKTIEDELDQILRGILNSSGNEQSLTALEEKMQAYFANVFQEEGVKAFFDAHTISRSSAAEEATEKIDRQLTAIWLDPSAPISLSQAIDLIDRLNAHLTAQTNGGSSEPSDQSLHSKRRTARKKEWLKITKLSAAIGKRKSLLHAHIRDLKIEYSQDIARRCEEADREFRKTLLAILSRRFKNSYEAAFNILEEYRDATTNERNTIDHELRDMQATEGANKYEFDRAALDGFRGQMKGDRTLQSNASSALREFIAKAEENKTVQYLKKKADRDFDSIDESLRENSMNQAKAIHRTLHDATGEFAILEDSLMDRLQSRFRGHDDVFENEVREFVNLAASSVHKRSGTQPAELLGGNIGVPEMPRRLFILGLPQHPFSNQVKAKFKDVIGAGERYISDFYTHDDPTQLRLLLVDYWMAARFSTAGDELREIYQSAEGDTAGSDLRYFCNVDPQGEENGRPDLFLPSPDEWRDRLEAELWLGTQEPINVVKEDDNGVFLISHGTGGKDADRLGDDRKQIVGAADIPMMFRVHEAVSTALSQVDGASEEFLGPLIEKESDRIESESRLTSEEYQHWMRLRDQLNKLLA